jgi:hypothetical protein
VVPDAGRVVVQFCAVCGATHPTAQCCVPEHMSSHSFLVCDINVYIFFTLAGRHFHTGVKTALAFFV